jgi:hypothetical protein
MSRKKTAPLQAQRSPSPLNLALLGVGAIALGGLWLWRARLSQPQEGVVTWVGPQLKSPEVTFESQPPLPPMPRSIHSPLKGASLAEGSLTAPKASDTAPQEGSPAARALPKAPLPPIPAQGWDIKRQGALAAPLAEVSQALTQDPMWERREGAWAHLAGGCALELSHSREGRLTGVTLSFEPNTGASAVIPPLENLLLGRGEPSMLQWELSPSEPHDPVGGRLHRSIPAEGEGEPQAREMFYYCEYGAPLPQAPSLPKRCLFTLEPSDEALALGPQLKPLRTP